MKPNPTTRLATLLFALAAMTGTAWADMLIGVAGPLTGRYQQRGLELQLGAERGVADVNLAGGVLGRPVRLISVDDGCDPHQAAAAANQLIEAGVALVVGHGCSEAAIAAAAIYETARIIQISPSATNPRLTDQGHRYVFRVCGRDDHQGALAGDYLAQHWTDAGIAILHDDTTYGLSLAEETRGRLRSLGVTERMFESYLPAAVDFSGLIGALIERNVGAVYIGGRESEAALIVLQAREGESRAAFVSGDALATDEFWQIAGPAAEGTRFTFSPDPRANPSAGPAVERFRAAVGFEPTGYALHAYAAVQVWAQAVDHARSPDPPAVIEALLGGSFETVLGTIGFDGKGDVTGIDTFIWYVWRDGSYRPAD